MAIGEFTFSLNFANAPVDQYARGNRSAMTTAQKRGAILFFGKAGCVQCHAVSGTSNEMFSDFAEHVIGVPQIAPDNGNVKFDGPGENEDFGLEQVSRTLRMIAMRSGRHRSATWCSSRRSCITAPTRGSRTPSGITSIAYRRRHEL